MDRMDRLEPIGHPQATRKQMRALAHPLRMRILELLAQSPSTATLLAKELGESTGSTSYHLRALARAGLIEEDAERGTARERWWRRRGAPYIEVPTGAEDPEGRALEVVMWTDMAERDDEALHRFFDGLPKVNSDWRRAATIANWNAWLTVDEAVGLAEHVADIVIRYRDEAARSRPEARRIFVSFRALPWLDFEQSSSTDDHEPESRGDADKNA
jgi:DNA-binding transcriptional ArsR family regulator